MWHLREAAHTMRHVPLEASRARAPAQVRLFLQVGEVVSHRVQRAKVIEEPHWKRYGGCCRCGKCCIASITNPEQWAAYLKEVQPTLPKGTVLDPVCANLRLIESKRISYCLIHGSAEYRKKGCADWPTHPNQIKNIRDCTYHFKWVGKVRAPRAADKAVMKDEVRDNGQGPENP
jgi:hypothetical protein